MNFKEKCSEFFTWYDFCHSDIAKKNVEPNAKQRRRIILMADIADQIQREWGKIWVTSGLRDEDVYDALLDAGYHPAMRSDHFCGNTVRGFSGGNGAFDFVPTADMKEVFQWIVENMFVPFKMVKLSKWLEKYHHIHWSMPQMKILKSVNGTCFKADGIY